MRDSAATKDAEVENIAYHFVGDYACGSHDDLNVIGSIAKEFDRWRLKWAPAHRNRPVLSITRRQGQYMILDTRGLHPARRVQEVDKATAALLLFARPYTPGQDSRIDLAIEHGLGVVLDSWYEPLATADPALMVELEGSSRESGAANARLVSAANGFALPVPRGSNCSFEKATPNT